MKKIPGDYFRSVIFGAEDSLVSTVGVLFGIATALPDKPTIILTGFIVIVVEALSMGAGAFLTETSAHEVLKEEGHTDNPIIDGVLMFFSYLLTGFIPLSPYFFFDITIAKTISVVLALVALFVIGFLPTKKVKSGFRMAAVAGFAIFAGFLIGKLLPGSI